MPSFEIPDGPTTVELTSPPKAPRTGTLAFTVTNKTDRPTACRLKVAPQADAQAEWFEVQGEKERPFAASETQKVTVNVAVPPSIKPGDFKIRLQAINVNDPGNDYAESAVATLTVKEPKQPSPPWPYMLAAAVLVLIVGGVAAWLLWPKGAQVPNVTGQPYAAAQTTLSGLHFTVTRVAGPASGNPPETVVSQNPAAGASAAASTPGSAANVTLTVDPGVVVPDVSSAKTLSFEDAYYKLSPLGLNITSPPKSDLEVVGPFNVIVDQDPKPSQTVAKGATVTLTIRLQQSCVPISRCFVLTFPIQHFPIAHGGVH